MSEYYIIQSTDIKEVVKGTNESPDSKPVGPMLWHEGVHLQVMRRVRKPVQMQEELPFWGKRQA